MKFDRQPYRPTPVDWEECYDMLCRWCDHHLRCEIVEKMIEMKDGAPWPQNGWVTDPGAGVTCLSYEPAARVPLPRQQRRAIARTRERYLPPICEGCAALKGSEASVSLHTRRDYQKCVRTGAPFICHEDPEHKRLCGGWCRAVTRKSVKVHS